MPRLIASAWTLAALCTALDAGILDFVRRPRTLDEVRTHIRHLPPRLVEALVDVLASSGTLVHADGAVRLSDATEELVTSPSRVADVAAMKSSLLQARRLLLAGTRGGEVFRAWHHHESELLELQGAGGGLMAGMLSRLLVPAMPGVAARLRRPGAAFLDVGAGVGRIAIAMAEIWPSLRVVGLEPWAPSLALARHNVAEADLTQRIKVRAQRVEDLSDACAFDLAWVPSPFISEESLREGLRRVHTCLRPGGWIVLGIDGVTDGSRTHALTRLVTATWGGCSLSTNDAVDRLTTAGFSPVQAPDPEGGPRVVLGHRGDPEPGNVCQESRSAAAHRTLQAAGRSRELGE